MIDYVKVFGRNVAATRLDLELTQDDLVKRLGFGSKPYISRVEHGYHNITLQQCERFAKALKVPLHELLTPEGK